ncbi:methyltransferase domain-containing protein [Allohahella marinimesophila]|uniref:Methyltransferase domain-containing protein n=1 Tax=Allohahella marinimesophila TaxID=1054972 RepID=A0ABP7NM87_9GAMM
MPEPAIIYLLQTPCTDFTTLRSELGAFHEHPLDIREIDSLRRLADIIASSSSEAALRAATSSWQRSLLVCWRISKRSLREQCQARFRACFSGQDEAKALQDILAALPWQDDVDVLTSARALLQAYQLGRLDQNDLVQRLAKLAVELDRLYRQAIATADKRGFALIQMPETTDPAQAATMLVERLRMNSGHSFEPIRQHFSQRIYASDKGRLRRDLILEDVQAIVGGRSERMQVLDVGCGEAPISRRLLRSTRRLVLIEPSASMLDTAIANMTRALAAQPGQETPEIKAVNDFAQAAIDTIGGQFDLILAHAIIEWTDAPLTLLSQICDRLAPGGRLSLAVYNEHGLRFRRLIRGHYEALPARPRPFGGGLTPVYPLTPDEIAAWCGLNGFRIETLRGLRCFADYQQGHLQSAPSGEANPPGSPEAADPEAESSDTEQDFATALARYQRLLAAEREVSLQDPFRQLARYLHIVIRRAEA